MNESGANAVQGPMERRWIPTTERLPEACKPVLGYADRWVDSEYNEMGMRECFRGDDYWLSAAWNNYQDYWDVEQGPPDYWMPYPSAPVEPAGPKSDSGSKYNENASKKAAEALYGGGTIDAEARAERSEAGVTDEKEFPLWYVEPRGNGYVHLIFSGNKCAFEENRRNVPEAITIVRNEEIATLQQRVEKTTAFKDFVHRRLDTAGVPKEFPDGKHTKEGCRIGDRLDWVLEKKEASEHSTHVLRRAMTLLREARCPNPHDVPTYDCPWCLAVKAIQDARAASDSFVLESDNIARGPHSFRQGSIVDYCTLCGKPSDR